MAEASSNLLWQLMSITVVAYSTPPFNMQGLKKRKVSMVLVDNKIV